MEEKLSDIIFFGGVHTALLYILRIATASKTKSIKINWCNNNNNQNEMEEERKKQ